MHTTALVPEERPHAADNAEGDADDVQHPEITWTWESCAPLLWRLISRDLQGTALYAGSGTDVRHVLPDVLPKRWLLGEWLGADWQQTCRDQFNGDRDRQYLNEEQCNQDQDLDSTRLQRRGASEQNTDKRPR